MKTASLPASLNAWGRPDFAQALKTEISQLAPGQLPLEQGATPGCYISPNPVTLLFVNARDAGHCLHITLGVFFTEIVVNCGCGVDPVEQHAQCHMQVEIDKHTAEARFRVVDD